jgi:tetratricopeptide (TPR) repeat protein
MLKSRRPSAFSPAPAGSRQRQGCQIITAMCLLLLLSLAGAQAAFAGEADPTGLFRQANQLYEKAKYPEAAALYQKLADEGFVSPALFYNLGCASFKEGKLGKAVLNFERALRLSPRDRDIRDNLLLARSRLKDEAPRGGGLIERLFTFLNLSELTWLASGLYFLFMIALLLFLARRSEGRLWGSAVLGVFLLVAGIWLGARIYGERAIHLGVITAGSVEVRNGPGRDYSTAFVLHEGTTIKVISRQKEWLEIGAFGRMKGWLPDNSQEEI